MPNVYVYGLRSEACHCNRPQWHAPCLSKVGETIVSYMKAARRKISATSAPLSYRRRLFAAVGLPSSALIHEDLLCIIPGLKDDISVVTEGVVAVWESLASASRRRRHARRASSALHGSPLIHEDLLCTIPGLKDDISVASVAEGDVSSRRV